MLSVDRAGLLPQKVVLCLTGWYKNGGCTGRGGSPLHFAKPLPLVDLARGSEAYLFWLRPVCAFNPLGIVQSN